MTNSNENIIRFSKLDDPFYVKPIELASAQRLDIAIKYDFALNYVSNFKSSSSIRNYLQHIEIINGYFENNAPYKIGKKDFLSSFTNLLDQTFEQVEPLPVGIGNNILDGAHRVASAILQDVSELEVQTFDAQHQIYDYDFFASRGFPSFALDELVRSFTSIQPKTRLLIIWPTAQHDKDRVLDQVNKELGSIIIVKTCNLTEVDAAKLVHLAYITEDWHGSRYDCYQGIRNKTKNVGFNANSTPFTICVFECKVEALKLVSFKENIRESFGFGKNSLHITDTHNETIDLVSLFCNQKAWHDYFRSPTLEASEAVNTFKSMTENLNLNVRKDIIITGGLLSILGYKGVSDFDYSTFSGNEISELQSFDFEGPTASLPGDFDIDTNSYELFGVRFLDLQYTLKIKEKDNRLSDRVDIATVINHYPENRNIINKINLFRYKLIYSSRLIVFKILRILNLK